MTERVERFVYDDQIARMFLLATVVWGLVGTLVGLVIALQLVNPLFNFQTAWLSFGRLRPLHTNAVIFAFAGNAIFTGVYYSAQRLLKARMWSDLLSRLHFWGWQAIIVAAAITLLQRGRRLARGGRAPEPAGRGGADAAVLAHRDRQLVSRADVLTARHVEMTR